MANYNGEIEIKISDKNFKKKSVFIQDSFKLPLFNDEMEKELKHITDWIRTQQISETSINIINDIIMEAIQINKELCINTDFNECLNNLVSKGFYDVNDKNIVSRKEFLDVNKNIKIIDFRLSAVKPFFSKHTSNFILYLMRQLQKISKTNNSLYYEFLYRFLLELYRADILIKLVD